MPKTSSLKFDQMLAVLMTEVIYGRAHFAITRGLRDADRAVLDTAPRFFAMTIGTHADSASVTATRLYDKRSGSVSIHLLLSMALAQAGTFKYATAVEVRRVVAEAKNCIVRLEPILKALRTRRNETIGHLDSRVIIDPEGFDHEGHASYRKLERLLEQTGTILNRLFLLYQGTTVPLDLVDVNDYQQALDLIADAKRAQGGRYEADHK